MKPRLLRFGRRQWGAGLVLATILALTTYALAVPPLINYQGFVRRGASRAPLNGTFRLSFSLYADSTGGPALWNETHNAVSVSAGMFNVLLGSVTPLPPTLFDGSVRWLATAVADTTLMPRRPIVSVAYSFKAARADTAAFAIQVPGGTAWTSLSLNPGFSNEPDPWQSSEYRRIGDQVFLRGAVRKATDFGVNDLVTTLPAGFRPPHIVSFITFAPGGALGPGVIVYPWGDISIDHPITTGIRSLDLTVVSFSITP